MAREELIGAKVAWKLFSDDITSSEGMDASTKNRFFVWPSKEKHKKKEMCRGKKDSGMRRRFTKKGMLFPSKKTKKTISADYM